MAFKEVDNLPKPARYFPLDKGIYEVAPNFRNFGTDFGNGSQDQKTFQLDSQFSLYRCNKLACRSERLSKYVLAHELTQEIECGVYEFMVNRMLLDWPNLFVLDSSENLRKLHCKLTGETLLFDRAWIWIGVENANVSPTYVSGLDALACQIQEDIAITSRTEEKKEGWLSALHLCSPSHWAPESKIGRNFADVHRPIAGAEKMIRTGAQLVDGSIRKGPYVRFVWGFGTDSRLNHHPEAPSGVDPDQWKGRVFDKSSEKSPFILRLERQLIFGLPHLEAYFFGIHVYFIDGEEIRRNDRERNLLRSALLSMTPESLDYKGLRDCLPEVIDWFDLKN
ncbi:DUF3445 domain-containing protein [bacterium]|nr:DUF3445 domain-containing protein [bacterium]